MAVSRLNDKVEERREEKWDVSLQPVWAQEPRKSVRETSGLCINGGELNHYISRLRDELQKVLQPAMD